MSLASADVICLVCKTCENRKTSAFDSPTLTCLYKTLKLGYVQQTELSDTQKCTKMDLISGTSTKKLIYKKDKIKGVLCNNYFPKIKTKKSFFLKERMVKGKIYQNGFYFTSLPSPK